MTAGKLTGRTALVTGASSGIGKHLAGVLCAAGARVVMAARRVDRTESIAAQLRDLGHQAIAVEMDVTDEHSTAAAFDRGEAQFGLIDTIIVNAGVAFGGRATDVSSESVRSVIDTNLYGTFLSAREGAKRLIAAGSRETGVGRIVLMGSITAQMSGVGEAAYAASKAGVAHLGRQFAKEWVRLGINVNTVQPGYIRTALSGDWFDMERGKAEIASWPRRRLMDIDSLDDIVVYLCSDASRFVTGSTIGIDDGQSL